LGSCRAGMGGDLHRRLETRGGRRVHQVGSAPVTLRTRIERCPPVQIGPSQRAANMMRQAEGALHDGTFLCRHGRRPSPHQRWQLETGGGRRIPLSVEDVLTGCGQNYTRVSRPLAERHVMPSPQVAGRSEVGPPGPNARFVMIHNRPPQRKKSCEKSFQSHGARRLLRSARRPSAASAVITGLPGGGLTG